MRLLYFSPVHYHSYYQRPHYMIRYFLDKNPENTVLWINPYPTRLPNWQDISRFSPSFPRKRESIKNTAKNLDSRLRENDGGNRLEVISPKALPIEPLYNSDKINDFLFWKKYWGKINDFCDASNTIIGIGRPSKFSLLPLEKLKYQFSFYDAMDDFPEFYSGLSKLSMMKVEKMISNKVEKIFVSSTKLSEKFTTEFSNKTIKILNGYDMSSLLPLIHHETHKKSPVIFGFVGTIGQWFSWSIVIELAKKFPGDVIRLVGPQYVKYSGILPNNIELLPECTQPEAINHVSKFNIGLIPFKQNALTQGVDPIKYYEYRAMGLSILSTKFGEMLHRGPGDGVYFFDEINTDALFSYQADIEKIALFRKENDWRTRFSLCGFPS